MGEAARRGAPLVLQKALEIEIVPAEAVLEAAQEE